MDVLAILGLTTPTVVGPDGVGTGAGCLRILSASA